MFDQAATTRVNPELREPHTSPAQARAHLQPANLTILALDLATQCGWAVMTRAGKFSSGSKRFDPKKLGSNGARWLAFREWLTATARESDGIQAVYYEDVRRHVSNLSARVYCGYLAILEAWAAVNNIPLYAVGVGTIKKTWTGFGNASKGDMIGEAKRRGIPVVDDNQADAIALLAYALAQEV